MQPLKKKKKKCLTTSPSIEYKFSDLSQKVSGIYFGVYFKYAFELTDMCSVYYTFLIAYLRDTMKYKMMRSNKVFYKTHRTAFIIHFVAIVLKILLNFSV